MAVSDNGCFIAIVSISSFSTWLTCEVHNHVIRKHQFCVGQHELPNPGLLHTVGLGLR